MCVRNVFFLFCLYKYIFFPTTFIFSDLNHDDRHLHLFVLYYVLKDTHSPKVRENSQSVFCSFY